MKSVIKIRNTLSVRLGTNLIAFAKRHKHNSELFLKNYAAPLFCVTFFGGKLLLSNCIKTTHSLFIYTLFLVQFIRPRVFVLKRHYCAFAVFNILQKQTLLGAKL